MMISPTGKNNPNFGNSHGFTLIELMAAVVILSFGLVLVLRSFVTAVDAVKRLESIPPAVHLLEEKMEEIKNDNREQKNVSAGESAGEFPAWKNETYAWKLNMNPTPSEGNLSEAQMTITWKQGTSQRTLSAFTYLELQNQTPEGNPTS